MSHLSRVSTGGGIGRNARGIQAAVILSVVLINGLLGFVQEGKAEKALDSISTMLSADARCMRGGETLPIPAEELVPGDVVLLESGDKVPADLRLTEVKNLRTEEAALTGESVPVDKTIGAVSERATVGDREGMAFSGTLVASGRGRGVVVATGADTELGRINQLMAAVSPLDTPLLRQIKGFSYAITGLIAVRGVLLFAYGRWVRHMPFIDIFQAVVSATVSIIPEGLPTLITVPLAIGVQRMAQRQAVIRRLPAVETLGSVSRICSDKTGTLTPMEMMVVSAVTADAAYTVSGEGYAPEGDVRRDGRPPAATRPSRSWGAWPCPATTPSCARRTAAGWWTETRRRARSIRSRASSASSAGPNWRRTPGSTRSRLSRSTNWPRCMRMAQGDGLSSSRAHRRSSSIIATASTRKIGPPRSTAGTS